MCGILSLEWGHTQPKRRKPMDKSCRLNGNFHSDNRAVKCGTPGLYRSPEINIQSRYVVAQTVECQMLINPAQPLQT